MSYLWVPVLAFVFLLWRGREQAAAGWRQRSILPAGLYWGIAGLYAFAGASFSFAIFGASHLRISVNYATLQFVAMGGIIAMGMIFWLARKLAKPWFEAGGVSQASRNHMHGVWSMFWVPGFALGFLPLLFQSP